MGVILGILRISIIVALYLTIFFLFKYKSREDFVNAFVNAFDEIEKIFKDK